MIKPDLDHIDTKPKPEESHSSFHSRQFLILKYMQVLLQEFTSSL